MEDELEDGEVTLEAHQFALDFALSDFEREARLILRKLDADEIPTLYDLMKLNKSTGYLYFILNGC